MSSRRITPVCDRQQHQHPWGTNKMGSPPQEPLRLTCLEADVSRTVP